LFVIQFLALEYLKASNSLLFNLNRVHWAYLTIFFVSAAAVLWTTRARPPPHSAAAAQVDYARHYSCHNTVYVVLCSAVSVRSDAFAHDEGVGTVAGLLPLTFGYAIFRYRLMDVDLIFKRGMAYTLAAAAIVGLYFAGVASIAELVHTRVPVPDRTG